MTDPSEATSSALPTSAADRLQRAVQNADAAAIRAVLHDDVRFFSPASDEPTTGSEGVARVLATAGHIYGAMAVQQLIADDASAALFFTADVDGLPLQVCYRLDVGADGLVTRLDALMRPADAAGALVSAMMRRLQGGNGA